MGKYLELKLNGKSISIGGSEEAKSTSVIVVYSNENKPAQSFCMVKCSEKGRDIMWPSTPLSLGDIIEIHLLNNATVSEPSKIEYLDTLPENEGESSVSKCSFCGKWHKIVVDGPGVCICPDCVELAQSIIEGART